MPPRPTSRTISKSPSRWCAVGWSGGEDIRLPCMGVIAVCCLWANVQDQLPGPAETNKSHRRPSGGPVNFIRLFGLENLRFPLFWSLHDPAAQGRHRLVSEVGLKAIQPVS